MRRNITFLLLLVLVVSCGEQPEYTYGSGGAALASGERTRGWIPEWLPGGASCVHLKYDIDTNERWLRFELSQEDRVAFHKLLRKVPDEAVGDMRIRRPRFASWWFEDLIQQQPANDAALYGEVFVGAGKPVPGDAVVVFDSESTATFIYIGAQ